MIIRVSGNKTGICDYLEKGKKSGREYKRDELDQRLILEGDLNTLQRILDLQGKENKENYMHFTLSFKEQDISEQSLQEISNQFKDYLFTACYKDEFYFYSEAHLPKIKNLEDKNGNYYERFPHIHIVIPKYNLLTNQRDDFLGLRKNILNYLNAFQEEINLNYNLSSPKDNKRQINLGKEEILNRYKFNPEMSILEIKKNIFSLIQANKEIQGVADLARFLQNFGEVRVRKNEKITGGEYINLKIAGKAKGINLKDEIFLNEYLKTRNKAKIQDKNLLNNYSQLVLDWKTKQAFYQRFISSASEKQRKEFFNLSPEEQVKKLGQIFQFHCAKISKNYQYKKDIQGNFNLAENLNFSDTQNFNLTERLSNGRTFNSRERRTGIATNESGNDRKSLHSMPISSNNTNRSRGNFWDKRLRWQHLLSNQSQNDVEQGGKEQGAAVQSFQYERVNLVAQKIENQHKGENFSELIKKIDLNFLLNELERNFNLDVRKFKVITNQRQNKRILFNNNQYSASDFLTKYLNLNWQESRDILNKVWQQQQLNFKRKNQRVSPLLWANFKRQEFLEKGSYTKINAEYRQKKEELLQKYMAEQGAISKAQKVVISKLTQRQITAELLPIRQRYWQERKLRSLKEKERYFLFLYQKAEKGNSFALWELQRLYPYGIEEKEKLLSFIPKNSEIQPNNRNLFNFSYSIQIAKNGNVSYQNAQGIVQIYETFSEVRVKNKDSIENIINALKIAKLKFGTQSLIIQNAKTEDLMKIKKAAELSKTTIKTEQIVIEAGENKKRKL